MSEAVEVASGEAEATRIVGTSGTPRPVVSKAAIEEALTLLSMPGGNFDASKAAISLTLPAGWASKVALTDPALVASLRHNTDLKSVAKKVSELDETDGCALDFGPAISALKAALIAENAVLPATLSSRCIVIDVDEPMASIAGRNTAADMGGVYTPLSVEGADWAAEILTTTADDEGVPLGMAMYLLGYEDRTALIAGVASLDIFDVDIFRSIIQTARSLV